MSCGDNTGIQNGLQGDPVSIDIGCLQPTNGQPNWVPAGDQLPLAYDASTESVWFYSCDNGWVTKAGFTLCGLNVVDLDVINPANVCSDVHVPVTYSIAGQCFEGYVSLGELTSKFEELCLTPYPDVVSGDGSITVSSAVDPATGQIHYDVAGTSPDVDIISGDNSINVTKTVDPNTGDITFDISDATNDVIDVEVTGPVNGIYTITITYEDGTTKARTITDTDTQSDGDGWTDIVDNGDGTFTATLPNGNQVTWTEEDGADGGLPDTDTRLTNPRAIDANGDGRLDTVEWDVVDKDGNIVGQEKHPMFNDTCTHQVIEEVESIVAVAANTTDGDTIIFSDSWTNNTSCVVLINYIMRKANIIWARTAAGTMIYNASIFIENENQGIGKQHESGTLTVDRWQYDGSSASKLLYLKPGETATMTATLRKGSLQNVQIGAAAGILREIITI